MFQEYFQIDVKLFYKYGTIYREVMHTPRIDACEVVSKGTDSKAVKMLIDFFNSTDLVHKCPYNVERFNYFFSLISVFLFQGLLVRDLRPEPKLLLAVFPSGDYKLLSEYFVNTEFLLTTEIALNFNTSNKDTFGQSHTE